MQNAEDHIRPVSLALQTVQIINLTEKQLPCIVTHMLGGPDSSSSHHIRLPLRPPEDDPPSLSRPCLTATRYDFFIDLFKNF